MQQKLFHMKLENMKLEKLRPKLTKDNKKDF